MSVFDEILRVRREQDMYDDIFERDERPNSFMDPVFDTIREFRGSTPPIQQHEQSPELTVEDEIGSELEGFDIGNIMAHLDDHQAEALRDAIENLIGESPGGMDITEAVGTLSEDPPVGETDSLDFDFDPYLRMYTAEGLPTPEAEEQIEARGGGFIEMADDRATTFIEDRPERPRETVEDVVERARDSGDPLAQQAATAGIDLENMTVIRHGRAVPIRDVAQQLSRFEQQVLQAVMEAQQQRAMDEPALEVERERTALQERQVDLQERVLDFEQAMSMAQAEGPQLTEIRTVDGNQVTVRVNPDGTLQVPDVEGLERLEASTEQNWHLADTSSGTIMFDRNSGETFMIEGAPSVESEREGKSVRFDIRDRRGDRVEFTISGDAGAAMVALGATDDPSTVVNALSRNTGTLEELYEQRGFLGRGSRERDIALAFRVADMGLWEEFLTLIGNDTNNRRRESMERLYNVIRRGVDEGTDPARVEGLTITPARRAGTISDAGPEGEAKSVDDILNRMTRILEGD